MSTKILKLRGLLVVRLSDISLHRLMSPSSIRVSRYRKEAVTQARGANILQASLSEREFELESQSKELAALWLEQRELREGLAAAWREKEGLLERWMDG